MNDFGGMDSNPTPSDLIFTPYSAPTRGITKVSTELP